MELMDMPLDEFMGYLPELEQMGYDRDELIRMYRAQNSPMAPVNAAAEASAQEITDAGRRPVAGGLFSKPVGATGWDAIMGLDFEGWNGLTQAGAGIGQAVDAPMAAAQGLIPQGDMALEALGTAGAAMTGGGAATTPRGSLRAGIARNADNLTDSETMARRILDMRAAGRARDVTDDMMAQADPQYMFNNTPLPMDAASRAARADEAGFDAGTPLYHGTGRDFQSFQPSTRTGELGSYFANEADVANEFAYRSFSPDGGGGSVVPALNRSERYSDMTDIGAFVDAGNRSDLSRASGGAVRVSDAKRVSSGMMQGDDAFTFNVLEDPTVSERLREKFDTIDFMDFQDGGEAWNRVVSDPRNIRSRFARFDPEFAHLSNLSAANADYLTGLVASGASDEEVQAAYQMILDLEGPR